MRRAVQLTLRAAKSTAPKPKAPQPPRPPMSHDAARRARARADAIKSSALRLGRLALEHAGLRAIVELGRGVTDAATQAITAMDSLY